MTKLDFTAEPEPGSDAYARPDLIETVGLRVYESTIGNRFVTFYMVGRKAGIRLTRKQATDLVFALGGYLGLTEDKR